jgi:hypothetical protein
MKQRKAIANTNEHCPWQQRYELNKNKKNRRKS